MKESQQAKIYHNRYQKIENSFLVEFEYEAVLKSPQLKKKTFLEEIMLFGHLVRFWKMIRAVNLSTILAVDCVEGDIKSIDFTRYYFSYA